MYAQIKINNELHSFHCHSVEQCEGIISIWFDANQKIDGNIIQFAIENKLQYNFIERAAITRKPMQSIRVLSRHLFSLVY